MTGQRDVVSIGETMLYFQGEDYGALRYVRRFEKFVGGTESNTMMSLAKLGFSTGWISRLGRDEFGCNIRDFIRGHGVDVSRVTFDDHAPTGVFFVEKNANDETRSYYYRAGSAASRMEFSQLDLDYIASFKILLLTGITSVMSPSCRDLMLRLFPEAKARGLSIALDPNLRLRLAGIEEFREALLPLVAQADYFLPSEQELLLLTDCQNLDEAIDRCLGLGAEHLVIKKGAEGALLVKDGVKEFQPAFKVKRVVSSMAAGDAFNAGYLAGLLKGFSDRDCLRLANCLGAMCTMAWGPYEGIPDWEEVMAYFEGEGTIQR